MMTSSQMPEACVSLMGKYATIIDFLNACNPSMQFQVCKDASSCFFGDFPTLSVIDRTYGERKSRAWLIPQLVDLSLCCHRLPLAEDQRTDALLLPLQGWVL